MALSWRQWRRSPRPPRCARWRISKLRYVSLWCLFSFNVCLSFLFCYQSSSMIIHVVYLSQNGCLQFIPSAHTFSLWLLCVGGQIRSVPKARRFDFSPLGPSLRQDVGGEPAEDNLPVQLCGDHPRGEAHQPARAAGVFVLLLLLVFLWRCYVFCYSVGSWVALSETAFTLHSIFCFYPSVVYIFVAGGAQAVADDSGPQILRHSGPGQGTPHCLRDRRRGEFFCVLFCTLLEHL